MEKVTYVWKIKLSRPWTFHNDSCRLRIISHLYWWSNSEVFVDVWLSLDKSIAEFPTVYKKMSALVCNRVYNHDFGLLLVQLYLFRVFRMRFSLSVSRACLVICKSAKKWYEMRMCFSWLCPFNFFTGNLLVRGVISANIMFQILLWRTCMLLLFVKFHVSIIISVINK